MYSVHTLWYLTRLFNTAHGFDQNRSLWRWEENCAFSNAQIQRVVGGSIVQNRAQPATVDGQTVGVIDKTKLLELHHEMADARSGRADHLR